MQGARRFASNSTLRSMVCVALVAAVHATVHADAPGMLLSTTPTVGKPLFEVPFRKFARIGQHGPDIVNGTSSPLTAILPGGAPFVFTDDPASSYAIPPSDLRPITDIAFGVGAVIAVQDDGWVRSWGPHVLSSLPQEPVVDLSVGLFAAAVGKSGTVHVWDATGALTHSGTSGDTTQVAIADKWGLALRTDGSLEIFTFLDGAPPTLALPPSSIDVAAAGRSDAPRAIAIRGDGSLKSLTSPFTQPGDYRKIALSPGRLVALDGVGRAQWTTWNDGTADWIPLSDITGRFDDVGTTATGTAGAPMFAICSTDSDRNGEEDRLQILQGSMFDVNGDLVNDAVQPPSILLDLDANNVADVLESATISGRKKPAGTVFCITTIPQQLVGLIALDRVPAGAQTLRTVRFQHTLQSWSGASIAGREVRYGIWLDPNGDGSPIDAVQLFEGTFVLNRDGVQSIDLGDLYVGPPGTCVFHGLLYSQPTGQPVPCLFPTDSLATFGDPFAHSRRRSRCWFHASAASASVPNLTSMHAMRDSHAIDPYGLPGYLSSLCLTWNDRRPTDADNDGALDVFTCGAASPTWWITEPDRDSDGVPDGTSPDCDGDGSLDIVAIRGGASDCDANLVADGCTSVTYWMPSQSPPTASGTASTRRWTLRALPRPVGGGALVIEASAALASTTAGLSVRIDGGTPISVFVADGNDCASPANTHTIPVDEQLLAALLADEVLAVEVASIGNPSSINCPGAFVRIGLQYTIRAAECVVNGIPDRCETKFPDCNGNGLDDGCELDNPANDVDGNGTLDGCELDCNRNGVPDAHELALDPSLDCDGSGYLDACEFVDCDGNGVHDPCQTTAPADDCNSDGIPDVCQSLADADGDGTPDACECPADISGDGFVTGMDLSLLMMSWGTVGDSAGDIDRDGDVDAQDLSILLEAWGVCGS